MLWGNGGLLVVDHITVGLSRLWQQFKSSTDFIAVLRIFLEEVQALECAIHDVKWYRAIASAEGKQLDRIGDNLDLPRFGLGDEPYRCVLRARIQVLYASGLPDELLGILNLLIKDGRTTDLAEFFPASFCLSAIGLTDEEEDLFAAVLDGTSGSGIAMCLVSIDAAGVFAYSSDDGSILPDFGFSSDDGTIDGAGFAHAIPL